MGITDPARATVSRAMPIVELAHTLISQCARLQLAQNVGILAETGDVALKASKIPEDILNLVFANGLGASDGT
jgi:hypothetical protein